MFELVLINYCIFKFDKITSLPASSDNLVANINETGDTVQDTTYLSKSLQLNNINRKEKSKLLIRYMFNYFELFFIFQRL